MASVKTENGFECEINEEALNDVRVVRALMKLDSGDPVEETKAVFMILEKLLGSDEDKLYSFIEARDGKATLDAVGIELGSIFRQLSERKKK